MFGRIWGEWTVSAAKNTYEWRLRWPRVPLPLHLIRQYPFMYLVGERYCESQVSSPRTQHNVPAQSVNPHRSITESSGLTMRELHLPRLEEEKRHNNHTFITLLEEWLERRSVYEQFWRRFRSCQNIFPATMKRSNFVQLRRSTLIPTLNVKRETAIKIYFDIFLELSSIKITKWEVTTT